jgi:hypothetical protein
MVVLALLILLVLICALLDFMDVLHRLAVFGASESIAWLNERLNGRFGRWGHFGGIG